VSNYRSKFPELYQFFGGYFYQGWTTDYRWEGVKPNFSAVIRHFKAVNPPSTVGLVRNELEDLLLQGLENGEMSAALSELGNNFYPSAEDLSYRQWLEKILEILAESPTKSRVLRELR
jgi:CdiI immunity protein